MIADKVTLSNLKVISDIDTLDETLDKRQFDSVEFYYYMNNISAEEVVYMRGKNSYKNMLDYMEFAECDFDDYASQKNITLPNHNEYPIIPVIIIKGTKYLVDFNLWHELMRLDKSILDNIQKITKVCTFGRFEWYGSNKDNMDEETIIKTQPYRKLYKQRLKGTKNDCNIDIYQIRPKISPNTNFKSTLHGFTQQLLFAYYIDEESQTLRFSKKLNHRDLPKVDGNSYRDIEVDKILKSLEVLKKFGYTDMFENRYYKPFDNCYEKTNKVAKIDSSSKIIRQMATLGDNRNVVFDNVAPRHLNHVINHYEPENSVKGDMDRVFVINQSYYFYNKIPKCLNDLIIVGHYDDVKEFVNFYGDGFISNHNNREKDEGRMYTTCIIQHIIDDIVMVIFARINTRDKIKVRLKLNINHSKLVENIEKKANVMENFLSIYKDEVCHLNYALWNGDTSIMNNNDKLKHLKMREILNNL